ncbi:AT-rich interactive domain-containing protein 1-like [Bidens hawaiensis]|uniref:AT-rich interactive domain-containing protein 1-like n=1 Tax=Bidens hawaiensis TaxID=980011 RepID=UPI00404A973E
MAGWSKVADGCALDWFRTLEAIHSYYGVSLREIDNKFGKVFNQIVFRFLKEFSNTNCYRPFPPMLGDGKPINLLRLYLCVREKGGYESVSRDGIWDLVAKEIGCGSECSASLKVAYVKYLDLLDDWFLKTVKDNKDLVSESSCFGEVEKKVSDSRKFFSDVEMKDYKEFVERGLGVKDSQSCVGSVEGLDVKDGVIIESGTKEETELSRKRKRERYLPMLDWVKRVSKDPCDLAIGSLPERSKWKIYGGEHVWKQVLSAREARLFQTNVDPTVKLKWQKNLRMHPAMYDDLADKSTSTCSQRLISAKETRLARPPRKPQPQDSSESSSTGSPSDREDEDSFWGYKLKRKRTPQGRHFQATVPEWTDQPYEPDSKWLGTPVWPLDKKEPRSSLIELERVGKGRQDSCGCQFPGSLECVRFHVSEKRNRVKDEVGSAFYKWKFDDMGESVALKWKPNEEKLFEHIINSNPPSAGITFWDDLTSYFKHRSNKDLVSYYFNVYVNRRRAHQNRSDPSNIDSDDDEIDKAGNEASSNDPGSIFCSPKKAHLKV